MVVRHITGQPPLPQHQVAGPEVKDSGSTSKQDRRDAVTGQLQSLTELREGSPATSRQTNAKQTGATFASNRSKRDTTASGASTQSASTTTDTSMAQREKVDTLYSLSGQANAVFDQKPR
ncbi:hypothetical protein, partial [Burkholderia lata]|uniref:hypothetical protein n=1 Tax=Burkholderia lata (strain ATCC 17760 / DSM 23089 / LMG 22485 / NCIMB 9086 / R18194 / 383) TaxID=482957 RepID=UPI0015840D36